MGRILSGFVLLMLVTGSLVEYALTTSSSLVYRPVGVRSPPQSSEKRSIFIGTNSALAVGSMQSGDESFSPITARPLNKLKVNRKKNAPLGGDEDRTNTNGIVFLKNCPAVCSCQGLSVDCSSRGLKLIPKNIPSNAVKLYLLVFLFNSTVY